MGVIPFLSYAAEHLFVLSCSAVFLFEEGNPQKGVKHGNKSKEVG